jgi:hypothetical protein
MYVKIILSFAFIMALVALILSSVVYSKNKKQDLYKYEFEEFKRNFALLEAKIRIALLKIRIAQNDSTLETQNEIIALRDNIRNAFSYEEFGFDDEGIFDNEEIGITKINSKFMFEKELEKIDEDIEMLRLQIINKSKESIVTLNIIEQKISCYNSYGIWKLFNDSCADSCVYARTPDSKNIPVICSNISEESCDCGFNFCWNGQSCEMNRADIDAN